MALIERIKQAQKILTASFGVDKKQETEGFDVYRYLTEQGLSDVYQIDASRKDVADQFINISKSVKTMRSSFFPIDFFLSSVDENQLGELVQDIQDNVAIKEPYENTFMRMLGMPILSWDNNITGEEIHRVPPDTVLKILNPISGDLEDMEITFIKLNILDQRKYPSDSRSFVINNNMYSITRETTQEFTIPDVFSIRNFTLQQKAALFSLKYNEETDRVTITKNNQEQDITDDVNRITEITRGNASSGAQGPEGFINPITYATISPTVLSQAPLLELTASSRETNVRSLSKDFYKFCYLFFPPIQDPEISNAINEVEKIVAPPFAESFKKRVNANNLKTPLLESVIRIRLDKISGTNSFFQDEDGNTIDTPGDIDDYGILESLFIVRLRSAITALASKMVYDIDSLISQVDKTRLQPAADEEESGREDNRPIESSKNYVELTLGRDEGGILDVQDGDQPSQGSEQSDEAAQTQTIGEDNSDANSDGESQDQREEEKISEISLVNLQNQKVIEDSLLFFLEDNKEILDLQAQTQRSSSIYDSHMMSGLLNIVDVPRKRINEEIAKIKESRDESAVTVLDELTQSIGAVLGTDIGIGTLDLAVFCLALFTLSEESLLGLLTPAQFDRIKKGEFKSLIPASTQKRDVVESINELTTLVHEGYNLFKIALVDPDSTLEDAEETTGAEDSEEG